MSDLYACIARAIEDGQIDRGRGEAAQSQYAQLRDKYRQIMPEAAAAAQAAADVKKAMAGAAVEKRHRTLAQLQRMRVNAAFIDGAERPDLAIKSLLEYGEGRGHDVMGVAGARNALTRDFRGRVAELLVTHGRDLLGRTRRVALLRDVIRALHGEQVQGPAAAMARAYRETAESARLMFNAHGGNIGKLDDWGVTHSHDAWKIAKAGFDRWAAEVTPRLDWSRIVDQSTGQPFAARPGDLPPPGAADVMLKKVYSGIVTRGADEAVPGLTTGGQSLAATRADHRVLHFRSADDWLAYNDAFGASDPFTAMVGHLDGMAKDIALMRVLGPNPKAGLEHAIQVAQRKADLTLDPEAANRVQSTAVQARAMLGHLTGAANRPADAYSAAFLAGTRAVLTAAQLGSALLSSVTDLWTMRMAARQVGMGGFATFRRHVQLMASASTRETARRMGYVADTLADVGAAQARFLGDTWTPETANRLASFVLRVSGLAYLTDMGRAAFLMEFSGLLAENAARAFDQIDAPLARTMRARGFSAADWDLIRDPRFRFTAPNGADFIAPTYWRQAALAEGLDRNLVDDLATRLGTLMEEQLEFAVPSVSLEGRTRVIGEAPPGTLYGELIRSAAMYKNFALSVTINQFRRTMAQPTRMARAGYFMQLAAGLTVLGGLAVQLRQMANGRDPRPMNDPAFWGAAVLQGGGLGIFGDFFASEASRAGGGLAETIGGPVVGVAGDLTRAVASNAARVAEGKDPLIGRDLTNLARRYTPGTSIWYARLTLDRLLWDQMQDLLDPEAQQQWRQQEQRMRRDFGTQSWWRRGRTAPDRAPDLSNALPEAAP